MAFYAVAIGREVGIFDTWAKCEEQIKGYRGARYKKFPTKSAAEEFINAYHKPSVGTTATTTTVPSSSNAKCLVADKKEVADFWPPSDGDSFDENFLTDEDLIMALEEVEGLPQPNKSLKRKNDSQDCGQFKSGKIGKYESTVCETSGLVHIGKYEFNIDSEGYVIVYTDGSCFNNGKANACAGFGVWFGDNHPLNAGKPVGGRVTNNVGEIQASIYAIKVAKNLGIKKLGISTDSQFLIKSITMWINGWKAKNWRLKNGDPVKNVVDFKELDSLLSDGQIDIKWNYVAGHKGIRGNEMADQLAREGSEIYKRLHLKK
ncbi:ribonuclease H1 [Musca vetustissima]|uniref:ribonuclease H1 n=1 Tax=Musca vetustissima TaxID=27455 RepID=UPI002AB714AA|nr:ribonuclease H1 [Musca vetustissima]